MRFLPLTLSTVLIAQSHAWNPFSDASNMQETALTNTELARLQVNAGWAKGDDLTLLFEVQNGLKGPIQCAGVQVDLKDGKSVSKALTPKLFVPPSSARQASLPQVRKGTMKAYAVHCTCFKQAGRGDCVNPLRQN